MMNFCLLTPSFQLEKFVTLPIRIVYLKHLLKVLVVQTDSSTQTIGTRFPPFPPLLEQINVPTRLCSQSKFLINRVCEYFRRFFADQSKSGSPGPAPIPSTTATLFGMSYHTVKCLSQHSSQVEQIPSCSSTKNAKTKKQAQIKALANCDPFVQDKIRRTIHEPSSDRM
jgi:hypothetical protein